MAYGRPVPELQRIITSEHFTELQAYAKRNTLNPDQWFSSAIAASMTIKCFTGEWVDPNLMVPGQVDPEKIRAKKMAAAERKLDKQADGRNR